MANMLGLRNNDLAQLFSTELPMLFRDMLGTLEPNGSSEERSVMTARNAWNGFGAFDLRENESTYVLSADLPGVQESDLTLQVTDGVLTISGKREQERVEKTETLHLCERSSGSFTRSFRLGRQIDASNIKAELAAGVLTVTLPKAVDAAARQIPVCVKR